ncbi:MAG TPA: hypothetical protein PL065_17305, partial [Polyangiaceae bacterium]|nr:hypothetical protein [Polyangiaceae bacterium]
MPNQATVDWTAGKKTVADLGEIRKEYSEVREFVASPDGERIAVVVRKDDDVVGVCVNGQVWEQDLEKAWHLAFGPDNRLTALVRVDDEWTVAVDGELWEERYEFVWNTKFSADGSRIAAQMKQDMRYGVSVNGQAWETLYASCRDYALSGDGE